METRPFWRGVVDQAEVARWCLAHPDATDCDLLGTASTILPVGRVGIEPTTFGLKARCSAWLSYRPGVKVVVPAQSSSSRVMHTLLGTGR